MQLKQFYDIATKVSSRKCATTYGDPPDWSVMSRGIVPRAISQEKFKIFVFDISYKMTKH